MRSKLHHLANERQLAAADPKVSVWTSANAGTGKTHLLVDRLLRLLLDNVTPSRILCLTFTRAAVAEMSVRLEKRLSDWATDSELILTKKLRHLLGREPTRTEISKAQNLFFEILDTSHSIYIRTIHSFCESLLSRFPLEAKLAPYFSIIDERRSRELRREAREQFLLESTKHSNGTLAVALEYLVGVLNEDSFDNIIEELDEQRADFSKLLSLYGGTDGLLEAGRDYLKIKKNESPASILHSFSSDEHYHGSKLYLAIEALEKGSKRDVERANIISSWLAANVQERSRRFEDEYKEIFLTQKDQIRTDGWLATKEAVEAWSGVLEIMQIEAKRVFKVAQDLRAFRIIEATKAILEIGEEILKKYRNLKETMALLDYDDLIERTRGLLLRKDGVSWVHFKLDEGLDHILVDEAQDTSSAQWDVILSLASDFFSGHGQRSESTPTVFGVGDEKQSIFSFQGAKPERFGVAGKTFKKLVTDSGFKWESIEFQRSWRSVSAILEVVDSVFSDPQAAKGLSWSNKKIKHKTAREGQAGLVELWPTEKNINDHQFEPWEVPAEQLEIESAATSLANKISNKIASWITSDEILESTGRPIEVSDILILVRTRGEFSDELVRALKKKNIPISGQDRMKLTEHLAIMDLIALGRFALLPDDDLNLATVLKGPVIGMSENALFELAQPRKISLWNELVQRAEEKSVFRDSKRFLLALLEDATSLAPFEFFTKILNQGARKAIVSQLGSESIDPIDEFLSLALEFENDHIVSLQGFLHWVETSANIIKRDLEQSTEEVRLMTVHGAKGLQAEIVILADTCSVPTGHSSKRLRWMRQSSSGPESVLWPPFDSDETTETLSTKENVKDESLCEYRRLLYVAMTRARDRLYVCGFEGKKAVSEISWYKMIENGMKRISNVTNIVQEDGQITLQYRCSQTAPFEKQQSSSGPKNTDITSPQWALQSIDKPSKKIEWLSSKTQDEVRPKFLSIKKSERMQYLRGNIIHHLLHILPGVPKKDRREKAQIFLNRSQTELDQKTQIGIIDECIKVIEEKKIANLFGPNSYGEVPISGVVGGPNKEIVFSGRVDRLLIEKNAVTIVDFKSNKPTPKTLNDVPKLYLHQLSGYYAVLSKLYSGRKIICLLLWTNNLQVMKIPKRIITRYLP